MHTIPRTLLALLAASALAVSAGSQETSGTALPKLTLRSPVDYQVFQRETHDSGIIVIEGTVLPQQKGGAIPDALHVRVVGTTESTWETLPYEPRVPSFKATVKAPSGGWYKVEVRGIIQRQPIQLATVEHVGIGEVFVVAGQSNSANHGESRLAATNPLVVSMSSVDRWQPCADPQPGASGGGGSFLPPLGDQLASEFKVPIAFVACGVGATSVREWLPTGVRFPNPPTIVGNVLSVSGNGYESNGSIYQRFTDRLKPLGKNGFRAVLWHQGESDANQADPSRTLRGQQYRLGLETLIRTSRQTIGWQAPWFVAQASYHVPGDEFSPEIRLAQRQVWEGGIALEGPDSDSLTGTLRERNGAGVHFSTEGLAQHANRWKEKISPWLKTQLATGQTQPPKPANQQPLGRLTVNGLFSDRAVLQHGRDIPVWGTAEPGANVSVTLEPSPEETKTATADKAGNWGVTLSPRKPSETPHRLRIKSGSDTVTLRDLVIGEVWLASGQSNMHWTLHERHNVEHAKPETEGANDPLQRHFTIAKSGSNVRGWVFGEPANSFGENGPAPSQPVSGGWHIATRNDLLTGATDGDSAVGYFFAKELRKELGIPVGILNASVGGTPIEQWSERGGLYNGLIRPMAPYAISGAIWYQGESNCNNNDGASYTKRQNDMVDTWRRIWDRKDLPFFYVQIAPFNYFKPGNTKNHTPDTLGEFWMAQTASLKHPGTGMVVINDITENPADIHPRNKLDVGRRLARLALQTVHRRKDIEARSPMFSKLSARGSSLQVHFVHTGGGLKTRDGKPPTHIDVSGSDHQFHPADAVIENDTLIVSSPKVPAPTRVRYGWSQDAMPNLAGATSLPVAPFDSQKWPLTP
jgi:sialate O-acetylesterase